MTDKQKGLSATTAGNGGGAVMERAERRAALISRMSHDLRAPLNAIISFSQILIDGMVGELNEEQTQQVEIIWRSGNNLLQVIDNTTTLARTDMASFGANPDTVNVPQMLEKLEAMLGDSGQGENAELVIRSADSTPERFTTDDFKLLQALNNMVRYAFHAGGAGRVEFEVSGVGPGAMPVFLGDLAARDVGEEGYLRFQIRHGCSEMEQQRISQLYLELEELDIADNPDFRGVHLGLSLARRLVETLGGRIWIERAANGDLLNKAVIPSLVALDAAAGAAEPIQTDEPEGQPGPAELEKATMTVLVVEDNPFNRNFIKLILDHMGFEAVEAENGEIGVRKALEILPDMVLMDMMMPVMDGFQATRALKADPSTAGIPVLAMTALSLEKDRRRARDAGCDDFLPMPASRDVLEEKLRFWAARTTKAQVASGETDR
jgi:CheY-like chemotaxis protein